MQKARDMHLSYLSQHFLCKLSTLCTFCLHCVDIQAFTQCIQPRISPTLYLHYLHFCLHYLHSYLHICLHCLHACLHCVDFHVVTSVYNPFFLSALPSTLPTLLHNHTRVSVTHAVPVSFDGIGRARNLSEQQKIRPPYARQARLLCNKKNTAACNACRRQCIQNSDLSTRFYSLIIKS